MSYIRKQEKFDLAAGGQIAGETSGDNFGVVEDEEGIRGDVRAQI